MLLKEKLEKIQELYTQARQEATRAKNELEARNKEVFTTLQSELENSIKKSTQEALEKSSEDLNNEFLQKLNDLTRELQEKIKNDFAHIQKETISTLEKDTKEELKNSINEYTKQAFNNLESDITPKIQDYINNNQMFIQAATLTAQKVVKELDLTPAIEYEKIQVDLKSLSAQIAQNVIFKSFIADFISDVVRDFLQSDKAKGVLESILQERSKSIFKQALQEDALIKMRFENALRVQALNILNTQELLQVQLEKSAKAYQLSKDLQTNKKIKRNILVWS